MEKSERCRAEVIRFDDGMRHHALLIPEKISERFRSDGISRLLLRIEGREYRRGLQRKRDGRWHLIIGQGIVKETGVAIGDIIVIELLPDPDPEHIDMGEELAEVLAQDREARERWETFSIGRRRSLSLYVTGAKRSETRLRRALELAEKIRTRSLHGDRSDQ